MLYINGKNANRLQNCLHAFYFECKSIYETIVQYELISINEDIYTIMDNYPHLLSVSLESMRYRIIIRLANMVDNDKKSLSINKILNLAEQEGIKKVNLIIKNSRKGLSNYENLINNIKLLRDRMYAHIDVEYSLEIEDLFDLDFEFINEQIENAKIIIKYMMQVCVDISKEYDDDIIGLKTSWLFDK